MVVHVQPVADLLAVAVDRQRAVFQRVGDHQRDQLLGELVRPVIVGGARDHHRQLVGDEVRPRQQIAGRPSTPNTGCSDSADTARRLRRAPPGCRRLRRWRRARSARCWCSRAASSSVKVPLKLVRTTGSGERMLRSTCDSAAKCTMASGRSSATSALTSAGVADIAVHEAVARRCHRRCARFSRFPA